MRLRKFFKHSFSNNAFSLVEVLIAFTILGFITVGMYSITDNNIATKERVLSEDERYLNAKMAFDIIGRDLNSIYSPLYFSLDKKLKTSIIAPTLNLNTQNKKQPSQSYSEFFPSRTADNYLIPLIEADKSSLRFLSSAHLRKVEDIKQSNYEWVEYKLSKNKDNDNINLVRIVEANNIYSRDIFSELHQEILLEKVKSLSFLFWHKKKKKFIPFQSLPEIEQNKWIAIQIKLIWINSDKKEIEETQIFRPKWPEFDVQADWKKRIEVEKKNKTTLANEKKALANPGSSSSNQTTTTTAEGSL